MAALEKLKQERPEVVESANVAAGLSLGEYTALAFAGAMSFEDGLALVCPLPLPMHPHTPHPSYTDCLV